MRTSRPARAIVLAGLMLAAWWTTAAAASPRQSSAAARTATPNIVFIYADDLGYGDVSAYGATAIRTPNIDALATEGLRFTDAHAPAATCTPSRYALLTGEYAWRRKGTGILPGNAALIIAPGRTTLASMLRTAGYATGVVGKWHLGLGRGDLDWNGDIAPGPLDNGGGALVGGFGQLMLCDQRRRFFALEVNHPRRFFVRLSDDAITLLIGALGLFDLFGN